MGDRLLYATPTGKHPHPGYVVSVRDMELSCRTFERRPEDFRMACGPVQMARTTIAEAALAGGCRQRHNHADNKGGDCKVEPYDFLVMHDDDLVVNSAGAVGNPIDAWHAIFDADPTVGVIGAVYLREKMETPAVVMAHPQYPEENCHVVTGLPAAPFPVSGIATGFMMIRVSALRELADKEDGAHALFRFPFNRTRWGIVNHTGEDYDFCARMNVLGYKVLADARVDTMHIKESGVLEYRHGEYESRWKPEAPRFKERCAKLGSALPAGVGELVINGVLCLDHVPCLKRDAERLADARAKRADAAKKDAA